MLAERLSDGFAMLLLASVGFLTFRMGLEVLVVVLVSGVVAVAAVQSKTLTMAMLDRAERFSLTASHVSRIRVFYLSAHRLLQWRILGFAVGLGLVSWFGECLSLFVVLWGLGLEPSGMLLLQATFVLAMATLVGSITMLPGGLGTAEGTIAFLLVATVGVGSDFAAAATLLIRLCTLWFGVSVGLLALAVILRRTSLDQSSSSPLPSVPSPSRVRSGSL